MKRPLRIGVDLGGTKIAAVALDHDSTIVANARVATPRNDYRATIEAIAALIATIETEAGRTGTIGIGIPGSLSPRTKLVRNANSTWLNGQDFGHDLEERLHREIRLANDADCFALSEARDGAAADAGIVFGVILGTGCGGGIVVNGKLASGPLGIAGEWGHNPLPWPDISELPGPKCWCGRQGCMETWVSGPGLSADHARRTGETLKVEEIAVLADQGDGDARASLKVHESRLARGLASVVNLIDPDVIVIGGGLSALPHLYDTLATRMTPHVFSDVVSLSIRPPHFGDASGVRGAAWLWD